MQAMKSNISQERSSMLDLLNKIETGGVKKLHRLPKQEEPQRPPLEQNPKELRKPELAERPSKAQRKVPERVDQSAQTGSKPPEDAKPVHGVVKKIKKPRQKPAQLVIKDKSTFITTLMPEGHTYKKETPIVALDCEMVICADGQRHLARVTIVNFNRHVLFDEHIKPPLPVKNYLTHITNITAFQLQNSYPLDHFLSDIKRILHEKIVVGHTIEKDFEVLGLDHEKKLLRDISLFSHFKNGKFRLSLKELSARFLNIGIQEGRHSSAEDSRAALELYKLYKTEIDQEFKDSFFKEARLEKYVQSNK